MSESEIEQAIHDAQEYAGQDQLRVEALELTDEAQKLAQKVNVALKDKGKQLDKTQKKQIKKDCSALEKILMKFRVDKVTEEQMQKLREAKEKLEESAAGLL